MHPRRRDGQTSTSGSPGRSPLFTGVVIVAGLALLMGLLSHITPLQSVGHGKNIQLASGSQPSYSPGELWGGGDPDEACVLCTVQGLFNEEGDQSAQPGKSVDPAIGDYTTTNNLFSINVAGGALSTSLTYDSEAASTEQQDGGDAGYFGWGWQSQISSTYSVDEFGIVTMDQYNSSQVSFVPALNDGCPTGDYGDFQKDTIAGSTLFFCSTSRLDAQLGDFGDFGLEFDEGNGDDTVYSWTGQLAWSGTRADLAAVTYDYDISPAAPKCANDGEVECFSASENVTGGRYISAQVDSFGLVQEVDDSYSEGWTMGYDSDGDLAAVSVPDAGETQYQYNTNQASPYSHEMAYLTNLNGGKSTIYYYPAGMVQAISAPVGGTTQYSYSISSCAIPPGCVASTDNQQATITYPDGESDVDRYTGAIPTGISYGPTNTFGGSGDSTWTIATNYLNDPADEVQYTVTMPDGTNVGYATDAVGNVISYTDALGNITRSMYNDTGGNDLDELCWTAGPTVSIPSNASCSNPPSGSTSYTYDGNGNVLSETDPRGYTNYDGYYTNGLLCWKAQASIGNGSACSNAGTSPNGAPTGSTAYEYTLGNVTTEISDYNTTSASTTQTAYNLDSEATSITSPNGNVTTYNYGGYDKLNSTKSPIGTTSYTYNGALQVVTVQSPATTVNGSTTYDWTLNTYDADGRLCWTQALQQTGTPGGTCVTSGFPTGSTGYDYSADDDVPSQVTDPNGNVTSYTYADLRFPTQPTTTTEPNSITYAEYNSLGQECDGGPVATPTKCPTASMGPVAGDSGSYINDEGQALQTWDPSGEETKYVFGDNDFVFDPTSVENPSGQTTTYSYDADGDEIEMVAPGGNTVEYGYNGMDEECYSAPISTSPEPSCTSVPTESGLTTYVWNNDDERSSMTDDVNGTENTTNYTYDADGNLTDAAGTATDGRNVSYSYNAVDEADCVSYPISSSQNCNNPPSSTNTVVDRSYDADGQLTSTTDWLGNTINYNNYNANGQVQQIQFPTTSAENLNYTYDRDGNLKSANYSGSFSAANSWTYNGDEQEASTTQPGFSSPTDSYNGYKQVTGASNPTSTGSSVSDAYSVAANGEMQKDTPAGGSAINYSYSNGTELASVTNPNLNASVADTSIAYTAAGQRCWQSSASSVVASPTCGSAPTGATSYQWNAYGQLCWWGQTTSTASCSSPPAGALAFTYNGDGLRTAEGISGLFGLYFSYDLVDGSVPLDIDDGQHAYIYGNTLFGGAAPVEQINLTTGEVDFLSSIPSGVQDVISSGGSVIEQSAYTTYGTREGTGTAGSTPFGFQGAYTDPTGLLYMISRYYDPATDQFISIDPDVAETGQPYAFTGGDPLNEADPSGLFRSGSGGQECGGGPHPQCNDGYGDSGGSGAVNATGTGDNGSGCASVTQSAACEAMTPLYQRWAAHPTNQWKALGGMTLALFGGAAVAAALPEVATGEAVDAGADGAVDAVTDESGSSAEAACGGSSFAPMTKVRMANGKELAIDKVKIGEKVLATNPSTGKTTAREVTAVWVNADTDLFDLTVEGSGGQSIIRTTQHHLFFDVSKHIWVQAQQLTSGDALYEVGGAFVRVVTGHVVRGSAYMWDLTVKGDHDFYVSVGAGSQTAVLVHNCTVPGGVANLADNVSMSTSDALDTASEFLGDNPTEVDDGVFQSAPDENGVFNQVRMTDNDLVEDARGPHLNFEQWQQGARGASRIFNYHVWLPEEG